MKQGTRFFLKPGSFINQLQWSSHHMLILAAFFASALLETQFGGQQPLYGRLASLLAREYGLGLGLAVWIVTFLKLLALQLGAWVLTECIYFLGTVFGKPARHFRPPYGERATQGSSPAKYKAPITSRRVLFRRLAVVFSLLLLAQTASGLADSWPVAWFLCAMFWVWGVMLGYFTVRKQFDLSFSEASAIGIFALLLAVGSWSYATLSLQQVASYRQAFPPSVSSQLAKRPSHRSHYRR